MNQDQLNSMVTGLIKALCGALIAHGMTKAGNLLSVNTEDITALVGLIATFIYTHKWNAPNSTTPPIVPGSGKLGLVLIPFALAFMLFASGCKTNLEAGGAYDPIVINTNSLGVISTNAAPDVAFFTVESSFVLAYVTADAAFNLEKANRALLWKVSPSIKHTLDSARPIFAKAVRDYGAARAVYKQIPTAYNLSLLSGFLGIVQSNSAVVVSAVQSTTNSVTQ